MAVIKRSGGLLTRRRFLTTSSASAGVLALDGIAKPYLSRAGSRPLITHGIQSGDVFGDAAMVWARTDRPSRMLVEVATTDSFRNPRSAVAIDVLPESDFTAKALIEDLPPGQDVFYRLRFQDLSEPTIVGEPQVGRLRTAPADRRSVSFVWSGDCAGEGWGIDESRGGMRSFATMQRADPDFFIHCGDSIYADCPLETELALPGGGVWKNVVTEEKSRVAETLTDYRGNYKYNLLDPHVRSFNAAVPTFALWDDHEVTNKLVARRNAPGLFGSQRVAAGGARTARIPRVHADANQPGRARSHLPQDSLRPAARCVPAGLRSYRGPNTDRLRDTDGPESSILGRPQAEWLKRELRRSNAVWKVIAADLPIGLVSADAVAHADGPPAGRELEIADLLRFIKRAGVLNTIWLTADMHYTAAHYYDPNRAVFQDFEPFWEFVSGPLHAGTWQPSLLDNTFGPSAVYEKGCSKEQGDNLAPCFGMQFFGHVAIDGATAAMTVTLKDVENRDLWSVTLAPQFMGTTRLYRSAT
jgi:alkaline phosphatase D